MEEDGNKDFASTLQGLQDALSVGSHHGCGCMTHSGDPKDIARNKFYSLLRDLGLKSPPEPGYGHLAMESLSAVLKSVTYDMSSLQAWPKGILSGKEDK